MLMILLSTVALHALAFMSDTCETVLVNGGLRINKSDYDADPDAYKLDSAAKQEGNPDLAGGVQTTLPTGTTAPPAPSAPLPLDSAGNLTPGAVVAVPTAPTPDQLLVTTTGKGDKQRWFVTDSTGVLIKDREGVDPAGYGSEVDAWGAIKTALLAAPH